ncbi:hypothetical protein [Mycobacterium leprae]|uniref:hypothetical protein n=1 Tax=Mycobacterium leprae TaxID=1769 RepID=UPI0039BEE6D2
MTSFESCLKPVRTVVSQRELPTLVHELLVIGHVIDHFVMAWCVEKFGHEAMLQTTVEDWTSASLVYTKRI